MITEMTHRLFGKITYDNNTGKITVEKPNLKERLTWLMAPEQADMFEGYHPDKFYHALELGGISIGITEYERHGEENIPPGAVM
jgi:hypothetical protein